jgi:hypothetical protein
VGLSYSSALLLKYQFQRRKKKKKKKKISCVFILGGRPARRKLQTFKGFSFSLSFYYRRGSFFFFFFFFWKFRLKAAKMKTKKQKKKNTNSRSPRSLIYCYSWGPLLRYLFLLKKLLVSSIRPIRSEFHPSTGELRAARSFKAFADPTLLFVFVSSLLFCVLLFLEKEREREKGKYI